MTRLRAYTVSVTSEMQACTRAIQSGRGFGQGLARVYAGCGIA